MSGTAQRPSTRSRDRTRALLLDAAAEVFAEIGVDAASVEAVCDRAGFTRGAFYSNFDSKDELLLAVTERMAEQKIDRVAQRVAELAAAGERLSPSELVERVIDVAVEKRIGILLAAEIRTRALRDPALGRMYLAWQEGMVERIAGFVTDLLGAFGLRPRLPAAEIARLMLQGWEESAVHAVLSGLDPQRTHELVSTRTAALAGALVDPA